MTRRSFFKGRTFEASEVVRPPWSGSEPAFAAACSACDLCVAACPEHILVRGADGTPAVDFRRGECTFCGDCAKACPTGALDAEGPEAARAPWLARAVIASSCLSARGITCRVCGDRCGPRAITFRLAVGGAAFPMIDGSLCNGCGACVGPCPVDAVTVVVLPLNAAGGEPHAPR